MKAALHRACRIEQGGPKLPFTATVRNVRHCILTHGSLQTELSLVLILA